MKIALIAEALPGGGAEGYVIELANRLSKCGDQVIVITSRNKMKNDSYPFQVIGLGSLFSIGEYSIWTGLTNVLKKLNGYLIHLNSYGYFHSDLTAFWKRFFNYRIVLTSHGFHGIETNLLGHTGDLPFYSRLKVARRLRPVYDQIMGRMEVKNSDALIALSQRDVEHYTQLGANRNKIRIIPPGVSKRFLTIPDTNEQEKLREQINGEPILLSVGELSWVKAKEMPLKALPLILKEEPEAKLVYIGKDSGLKKSLIALSKNLGVEKNVIFLDYVKDEYLPTYLRLSDILIHTSLAEGLSTILLEAMTCKLPFITTPAGGNGYLANETGAGLVVPFFDEKILADTVVQLWQDSSLLKDLRNNATICAPRFSWDEVFDEIREVYQSVLNA